MGFRNSGEHVGHRQPRAPTAAHTVQMSSVVSSTAVGGRTHRTPTQPSQKGPSPIEEVRTFKGLVPTFLMMSVFLTLPLLYYYGTSRDYTDTGTRAGVIVGAFLSATLVVMANDCVAWFNLALALHLAIEVRVIDKLLTYANVRNGRGEAEDTLAYLTAGALIFHLVPFFFTDHARTLIFMAYIGVIVNVAVTVITSSDDLMLIVSISSTMLLGVVMLVGCVECLCTSLYSQMVNYLTGSGNGCLYTSLKM
jgi:hypothetical protein